MTYPFLLAAWFVSLVKGRFHTGTFRRSHRRSRKARPGIPTIHSAMYIYLLDGTLHNIAKEETAYAYRDVKFSCILAAATPDPLPAFRPWGAITDGTSKPVLRESEHQTAVIIATQLRQR
jgi:hypothetical protein